MPVFIFSVNTHHSYSKHLYRRRLVSNEDLFLTSTSFPLRGDRSLIGSDREPPVQALGRRKGVPNMQLSLVVEKSSRVLSQPLHRFVSLLTLQEQFSQTSENFGRWIQNKKTLCSIQKFAYWQLKLCVVLTFYFFVFFYCHNKMKYSWSRDSSCLQSRLALEIGYKV